MRIRVLLVVCLLLLAVATWAAEMTPAVTEGELDLAMCHAFADGRDLGAAPAEELVMLLGIKPAFRVWPQWSTGEALAKDREFRVAFTQPIELGTICTNYTGGATGAKLPASGNAVSYLKAGAAYPGDVTKDDQWVTLPPGEIKTLPPGTKTRALRFSDRFDSAYKFASRMAMATLFQERYYSALNMGHSKVSGRQNQPEVWLGYWSEPLTVVGVVMIPQGCPTLSVEVLKASADQHPLIAAADQWQRLKDCEPDAALKIYQCNKLVSTRGIRLTAPAWKIGGNFAITLPLVKLGDAPEPPTLQAPPPPFTFKYTMPLDGFVAIDILDKTGKRVRKLVAEVERSKGVVEEAWDLKDDNGGLVPPGEYTVRGLARPPFKLTYELTVNNAGQPAWMAPPPAKGGGGWLADHTPPYCAATLGDMVFLGSQVAEGGHSLIAVDHDGNKLWGEPSVSYGFSGPERIAVDGKCAYLVNNALVQRVDPQNGFKAETIYEFKYPRNLPGNGDHWSPSKGGAAIRGDKLYVSYCAQPVPWLQTAFLPELIEPGKCIPPVRLTKGAGTRNGTVDKNYNEFEYDELMKLYAAFLTEATPEKTKTLPGLALPSSTQAYFGDAPTDGPLAGMVTVAFNKPVAVGSVVVPDANVKVFALKPGEKLPDEEPNMEGKDPDLLGNGGDFTAEKFDETLWVPLTTVAKAGQPTIALAPEGGVSTQALRFKTNRLIFASVMSRRFADLAPQAERVYAEGKATPQGGWAAVRDENTPISRYNPAMMGLVWQAPVTLRGIALTRPVAGIMEIDAFTGPNTADPKAALADDSQWKQVGAFDEAIQVFKGYILQDATLRNVDFGELVTTRALRLRVVGPPTILSPYNRGKASIPGPHHAGFDAVLACSYLGGDPAGLPLELHERISEFQLPTMPKEQAVLLRNFPFIKPGQMTFANDGTLYAVSDGRIVTVPLDGKSEPTVVIPPGQLVEPSALAFDADGLLYVGDCGPGVVKVFDVKAGKLLRTIGTPGGHQVGAYNPACMDRPTGLTIDSAGKLWIAHNSYQPKRVSRWTRDGAFEKDFLGVTAYGGGGWLDENDKSVLNYNGMKFVIDWDKRNWKLSDILFRPGAKGSIHGAMPDRVLYCQGRRYLVGEGSTLVICQEQNGVATPHAAAGNLGMWGEIDARPELRKRYSNMDRGKYGFVWVDKNGDGVPQADELQISEKYTLNGGANLRCIGDDLSLNFLGVRLRPQSFLANGTPVYDLEKLEQAPGIDNECWTTADGRSFVLGHRMVAPDGKTELWQHTDKFLENVGYYASGFGANRPAGVLNGEHLIVGHLKVGNEELFVTNSDQGDWFTFTGDGMLVGCIFGGPAGQPRRYWTMPEWEPGKTDLSGLCVGQEHYQGCVVKANDGKVYAVAGHNFNAVVRVDGLEKIQRIPGTITVTPNDVEQTQLWTVRKAAIERVRQEAKVAKVPYLANPIAVNGSLDDWPDDLFVTIHDFWQHSLHTHELIIHSQGALAYDEKNLYVGVRSQGGYPPKNSAEDLQRLFKYGDAVDLTLGADSTADPQRTGPAPGDLRILISQVKGRNVAMLYRYKATNADPAKRVHFKSPVSETWIDEVVELTDADISIGREQKGWALEAAIPWKSLGIDPPKVGTKLRGDIGLLQGDDQGIRTVNRLYWAGKSQTVISDLPSEARIAPALWGDLYFVEPEKEMHFGPEEVDILP